MPQCKFNKVAKHLDGCFCIRNVKNDIHSATIYCLLFSRLPKSYRKLKISFYLQTVHTGVFSSFTYRSLYSARFFSAAIHLSSWFVKK